MKKQTEAQKQKVMLFMVVDSLRFVREKLMRGESSMALQAVNEALTIVEMSQECDCSMPQSHHQDTCKNLATK